jgi:pre-mRNA-splicing factor 38A
MQYRIISKITRERILSDRKYKQMSSHTFDAVVQEICRLGSIGGIVGGVPHRFLCIIQRMEAMNVSDTEVVEILERVRPMVEESSVSSGHEKYKLTGNVYLIATLLFYLRLLENPRKHLPLFEAFLVDYRRVCVDERQDCGRFVYLDVFVDDLLNKPRMFNVHLKHMPGHSYSFT